jgi:hypothetical protein
MVRQHDVRIENSVLIQVVLVVVWLVGSLAIAWFARRRLHVYAASVALVAPAVWYSTLRHGPLEMGGILHALAAGVYVLPFHYFFQRFRARTQRAAARASSMTEAK